MYGYREYGSSECVSPGPIIRVDRGHMYKLILHNDFNDSITTNLHTHGLHISGSGNADDITRFVDSGNNLDYYWDIRDDHPSGTYWYHAHYHGHVNEQVIGGAFGVLIVNDC
mmetsp:Transcript_40248/g.49667  ORF Transcript_40248/g.49667 Transcript_40248/m.49667 type:complete len:112 (-) Transcript_40248:34-369(-)